MHILQGHDLSDILVHSVCKIILKFFMYMCILSALKESGYSSTAVILEMACCHSKSQSVD